jgi:hypothetical protein
MSCPGSIIARFSLRAAGATFFQPLQLDLELPDLPVQLGLVLLAGLLPGLPPLREDRGQLLEQLLPPLPDLVGMHTIVAGQLGQRALFLDRLEGDLGLEGGVVTLPYSHAHFCLLVHRRLSLVVHLMTLSSFWGAL